MGMNRQTRRWAAWIACFAILMASLAPSISHAMAAAGLSGYTILVAPSSSEAAIPHDMDLMHDHHASHGYGIHHHESLLPDASLATSHSPDSHSGGLHFEHCPFCFTHAGSFAIPISDTLISFAPAACAARMPVHFYQYTTRIFIWESAQPRAPPSFS
jgi:Protein of unknown function (DUF2946)